MESFSTYSFKDCGCLLCARHWAAREQKEQGLCSHGSYHIEGVKWEKPQKINK